MKKSFIFLSIAMAALWVLPTSASWAEERILSFHSDIEIHSNGSMTVTETIRVRAEGKQIKRGIYRDFPTTYKTARGRRHKVAFQVVGVRRDGNSEAWHTARLSNGMRVYFGRSDVLLKPGEYEYQFRYTTDRQIGFFDQHDELYWNVTGNGWAFPITQASARVWLPQATDSITGEAYTGPQGGRGGDWRWNGHDRGGDFVTTRQLGKQEGLTIVLGWPKGVIHQATRQDRMRWLWQDDAGLVTVWLGSLAVLLYYLLAWVIVGRDPTAGVMLPEYSPPEGYSPAALRLIRRMGYDDKVLSAALVHLAVQGAITIRERDDEYSVYRSDENIGPQFQDDQALLDGIGSSLKFRKSNHEEVRAC